SRASCHGRGTRQAPARELPNQHRPPAVRRNPRCPHFGNPRPRAEAVAQGAPTLARNRRSCDGPDLPGDSADRGRLRRSDETRPRPADHRPPAGCRAAMKSLSASIQQLRLREHQLFLALTIVVGVLAGLSAVLFTVAIDRTTRVFFGLDPSAVRLFVVPVAVSLITGLLLARVFPDVRGSGVPQTEAAYHLNNGIISGHVPLGKFLTGVLCIASGHSMGREGPSVQIGA